MSINTKEAAGMDAQCSAPLLCLTRDALQMPGRFCHHDNHEFSQRAKTWSWRSAAPFREETTACASRALDIHPDVNVSLVGHRGDAVGVKSANVHERVRCDYISLGPFRIVPKQQETQNPLTV